MEIVTQIMTFLAVTLPLAHPLTVPFFSARCLSGKGVGTLICSHLPSTHIASSDLLLSSLFQTRAHQSDSVLILFQGVGCRWGGWGSSPRGLKVAKGSNGHVTLAGMFLGLEDQGWGKSWKPTYGTADNQSCLPGAVQGEPGAVFESM